MSVKGKIAVITGGASGIGLSSVEQLLQHNVKSIAILDLPSSNGEQEAAKLNKLSKGTVIFLPCDVTKKEQVESCLKKVIETFGGLDILINSAGILNEKTWERMVDINFNGVVRTTLVAIDIMGKQKGGKGGTIVNIASLAGIVPLKFMPIYCATKHAVIGFTRCLSENYDETGVRALLMCPGFTSSPLIAPNLEDVCLDFVDTKQCTDMFNSLTVQPAEHVGRAVVELIENNKNGMICCVDKGEPPFTVKLLNYKEMTKEPL